MQLEKHLEILAEVLAEIDAAKQDQMGILSHQRRLALMLSLGVCELLELYFHKLGIIKSGSRIKHDWLRQKKVKEKLEQQLVSAINSVPQIDGILHLAVSIEKSRDDLAYSSPLEDDSVLIQKINDFLRLKKLIEEQVGVFYGPV